MMRIQNVDLPQQVSQQNMEPMLVDEAEASSEEVIMVNNPTLELETYASQYEGLAKLYRLVFIAERCPSLRIEALRMALDHVMGTLNVVMYQQIHKKLCDALSSIGTPQGVPDVAEGNELPPMDTHWIESRLKQASLKTEKLDNDLKNYKANSIKESIRRGTDDLGDHFLDCGELNNALRAYARARDYCTSGKHVVDYCMNVARVSVYLQYWAHVDCFAVKAQGTPEVLELNSNQQQGSPREPVISARTLNKLRCCHGIAELANKKYKMAATRFLQTNAYNGEFPDIMSAKDVAIYAGLCALASFDRPELTRNIINHKDFKQYLELDPQLRDIINHFYESRYGKCLAVLDSIKDNLLLDIYLAPHVNVLYGQIRNRAWVQYFSPYLSADMNRMALAFNTTVQQVEEEIMKLILDNQIQARIDSHNKILYAKDVDQRSETFAKCMQIGDDFERKTKALMLRAALIKNKIIVKSPMRMVSTSCMANGDDEKPAPKTDAGSLAKIGSRAACFARHVFNR